MADIAVIALSLLLLTITGIVWRVRRVRGKHSLRSVAILVLGDIGRSPRMMYHAQSFAENGFLTDLIGYGGSKPIPSLSRLPKVRIHYIPELPKMFDSLPWIVRAPIRIAHQVVSIFLCLIVYIETPPEFILVQNPPSIPTLALVQLIGRVRGSKVIIDWHNLGYSILAMRVGKDHFLVRLAKSFEQTFGYSAYAHLFVTKAMRDFLVKEWDLQGHKIVLHDRPPRSFHRSTTQEIHNLFQKLKPALFQEKSLRNFLPDASGQYTTYFTEITNPSSHTAKNIPTFTKLSMPALRPDRPALLVSSTSWTADENFDILLDALEKYNNRADELAATTSGTNARLPKVLVIVTGKGPLREETLSKVAKMQESWKWVRFISLWLEAADYPVLLGSADLGISLHSSSSGLDLPMKVIDMFGCGLPVCALNFTCLGELVKDGENGLVFDTSEQLASQFEDLLVSFPDAPRLRSLVSNLASLRRNTSPPVYHTAVDGEESPAWGTWEENWTRAIRPIILHDVNL
ncbi:hypothetical protein D9619_003105 [Psilocybe cf. subviscida]|uniref:Chitobiosyldiphosphodolichol beta-mannosyltransferase n=1 Tax=Psilocybe cf. subviscida TaxID=2480587 RepID=A0A8H5AWD5_9AGAR|nr:hypothetical protein D9619_003105 [Psilocybe cf. subviscida]